jgi:hypothetical protein
LPESEQFVSAACLSLADVDKLIESVVQSEMTPVVLDLHKLSDAEPLTLVLGFAGCREEVDWQLARAAELGVSQPASLDHEKNFWPHAATTQRVSVLPSKLISVLQGVAAPFVARAGNGVIYHRGAAVPATFDAPVVELMRRLKDTYDPNHIFPGLPL